MATTAANPTLTLLTLLETQLTSLITTLHTHPTLAPSLPQTQLLLSTDHDLSLALKKLYEHQTNYRRILELRREVEVLEGKVKDVVRDGVRWRGEIGEIIPGNSWIEEGEEEGNDMGGQGNTREIERDGIPSKNGINQNGYGAVDLQLLLKLGSRIGKHSTANGVHNRSPIGAKRKRAQQLSQESQQSQQEKNHLPNGGVLSADPTTDPSQQQTLQPNSQVSLPPESQQTLTLLEQAIISEREARSLAWPEASILRTGALGQLQLLRESDDNGVDGFVERMLRDEAEAAGGVAIKDENEDSGRGLDETATNDVIEAEAVTNTAKSAMPAPAVTDDGIGSRTRRRSSVAVGRRPSVAQQQRTKVKLDLYDEDDDEDDE